MPNFKIEQSSLIYRWTFNRMLPGLPGPGTAAFATLCKGLHPYGISPSEIILDATSARLSVVSLAMNLLKGRLSIRMTFGWAEFSVRNLLDEDVPDLLKIAEAVASTLGEIDDQVGHGTVQIAYRAHLSLSTLRAEEFLNSYLRLDSNRPELVP